MSRRLAGLVAVAILGAAPAGALTILNTKHDLGFGHGGGGVKATSQTQVCIFCHTAHRPNTNTPLWNHTTSAPAYTYYGSNYTNTYLALARPGAGAEAGTRTKMCLSCHDGVLALGNVSNMGPIAIGVIGATANLGVDLRNDHPVLYPVTTAQADGEMVLPPAGDPVKIYDAVSHKAMAVPANGGLVECLSCHDPHDNQYGSFLVKSNANAAICTTCHAKAGWTTAIHKTTAVAYDPDGVGPLPATTVGEWGCRDCHRMHGADMTNPYTGAGSAGQAYDLRAYEENTCFQCHGSTPLTGAKAIQPLFTTAGWTKHPTVVTSGIHLDPERDASNFTATPNRRHAECYDCHDPHGAQKGNRLGPPVKKDNLISQVLLYGWGAQPTWGGTAWQPPTGWTRVVFTGPTILATYREPYLCLKCHSSYAYGGTPPAGYTDQGIEFNPNNASTHPCFTPGTNAYCTPVTMLAPWNQNAGEHDTMMCSDCHGSSNAGDPEGPHGSPPSVPAVPAEKILQASLVATVPTGYANYATPLCIKCHNPAFYANNSKSPGSNYQHQVNGGMNVAPGADAYGYGGCLMCHGNLSSAAAVAGTFHGENGAWPSGPKSHFLANTTNFTDWNGVTRTCVTINCHVHSKPY